MRIAFFGTPAFAVPTLRTLLASRHQVVGVVTQPDRPRGRGHRLSDAPVKALAVAEGLDVYQPRDLRAADVDARLRAWAPDIGVVVAYGRIIPEPLLTLPPHGLVNVHASLLPKYRGAAPIHRAIIDGATTTGVTIMRVARLLDAGGMFARDERPIGADETSDVVEADLAERGAALLLVVLDAIEAGTASEEPQDDMLSTYAPRLTKADAPIDWRLPASYVHNRVRGLWPWPHASTFLDGMRLIVLRTTVGAPALADAPDVAAEPGTIVSASPAGIDVATGHGGRIRVLELQREGGRPLAVRDFLAGHRVQPGQRFSSS